MQHEFPFLSLLVIIGLATLLPLLKSLLRQRRLPLVVVEIVAGIIVGHSGLNLIEAGPALDFLALFGFTYLMFLSGLEMDYDMLMPLSPGKRARAWLSHPLSVGGFTFVATLGMALSVAYVLVAMGMIQHPFMVALILSTTSLGIVVPVLKERGMIATRYGQTLLVSAVVADFGTMLLITAAAAAISRGLTLDLLLGLLLLALVAVSVRLGRWATAIPGLQHLAEELAHTTTQLQVRATFALMVTFIVLSKWFGVEIILGAFLAGTVIALLTGRERSLLHMKLEAIGYGFFIPIFFIMVGVRFDLAALLTSTEALLLAPLLLVSAYAIKILAMLVLRSQYTWRETLAAGVLLSTRLSLIIAAASIALALGVITDAVNAAIILLAVVTCTLSPVLFNTILPFAALPARRGLILVGLEQVSIMLAERLRQAGEHVTLLGVNHDLCLELRRRGFSVREGDPRNPEILNIAGAESAVALLAIGTSDTINWDVCRLAQERFDIPNIIALASDPSIAWEMRTAGIRVVQPQLATVLAMEGAVNFPATFDMLANPTEGAMIREVTLHNRFLAGLPLRDIGLPGGALVTGLRRDGEFLIPHGDTILQLGDILMLVSDTEGLQMAIARLDFEDDSPVPSLS